MFGVEVSFRVKSSSSQCLRSVTVYGLGVARGVLPGYVSD